MNCLKERLLQTLCFYDINFCIVMFKTYTAASAAHSQLLFFVCMLLVILEFFYSWWWSKLFPA